MPLAAQILRDVGGKYFMGVNYCAMDKYTVPCSTEQWNTCRDSLKVQLDFIIDPPTQLSIVMFKTAYSDIQSWSK